MDDGAPFSLILHYSPEMVAELAMGADDPLSVAERYGVEPEEYERLASLEWFGRLVAQKRHEFHDTGMLFVAKAGMMAEALLTRLFQQSMAGAIPPPLTVEVAKQLTDIGRLKPQPLNTQPGQSGNAFQINIQVNGRDVIAPDPLAGLVAAPIDAMSSAAGHSPPVPTQPRPAAPPTPPVGGDPTLAISWSPKGTPPPSVLSNLRVPDFDLRPNPQGTSRPSPFTTLGVAPLPPVPGSR